MIANRYEIPHFQSAFYRDQYHKILRMLILEALIMICLILAILYYIFFQPNVHYYITTTSGQIRLLKGYS